MLWVSAVLLSSTLLIRGLLNIIRFADRSVLETNYRNSAENDTYFAPLYDSLMFVFSDFIPISSQLFSMIFGLIRKNY